MKTLVGAFNQEKALVGIVVRITFVSIFYYEDPADEYKSPEGSLMPLWNFRFEAEKELEVTHLMWSPNYSDLFAVSLGS